jgi:hypothetical protein
MTKFHYDNSRPYGENRRFAVGRSPLQRDEYHVIRVKDNMIVARRKSHPEAVRELTRLTQAGAGAHRIRKV